MPGSGQAPGEGSPAASREKLEADMRDRKARPALDILLGLLDEAFERKSWHGTNLRGSLRGLPAKQAAWRPGPRRHNIWEIAVHAAYWKYAVRRRL